VSDASPIGLQTPLDVGEYCRAVEAHLTRINEGQLVRIVGPAFELVRGWALAGVPLSIVLHGMNAKAERHKAGRSTRPLRLEFCEHDVRAAYDYWRRAVGISRIGDASETADGHDADTDTATDAEARKKHASLTKHLDRAIDRLVRAGSRTDITDAFRDGADGIVQALGDMRDRARGARGAAREEMTTALSVLDAELMRVARAAADASLVARLRADSAADLAAYRGRLDAAAWERAVELGVDRLLRDHFGLPTVAFDA
jgi:hypothetical protein